MSARVEQIARVVEGCTVTYACLGRMEDEAAQIARCRRDIAANIRAMGECWRRGFPQEEGWYLVYLADGAMLVTPYKIEPRWVELDEDWDNSTGWTCLTHSHARVTHWMPLPLRPEGEK